MGIRKTLLIASTALVVPLAAQAGTLGANAAQSQVASTLNHTSDAGVLYHQADWWNEGNDSVKEWWDGDEGGEGEEGGERNWNENGERGNAWNENGERGNWWNESGESGRHNWWNESGEAGERGKKDKWSKWNENGEGGEPWNEEGGESGERGYSWNESGEEGGEKW